MTGQGIETLHSRLQTKLPGFDPSKIIAIIQAVIKMLGLCPAATPAHLTNRPGMTARIALNAMQEDHTLTIREAMTGARAAIEIADAATVEEKTALLADVAA